jgi:hypothetical protein
MARVRVLNFKPSVNGLHFSNNTWPPVPDYRLSESIESKNFCDSSRSWKSTASLHHEENPPDSAPQLFIGPSPVHSASAKARKRTDLDAFVGESRHPRLVGGAQSIRTIK